MTTIYMSLRTPARDFLTRSKAASLAAPRIDAVRLPTTAAVRRQKPTQPLPLRLSVCSRRAAAHPYACQRVPGAVALFRLEGEVTPWK
jgi:hypothetical protein